MKTWCDDAITLKPAVSGLRCVLEVFDLYMNVRSTSYLTPAQMRRLAAMLTRVADKIEKRRGKR
jgi:hypothetical protein